MAQLPPHPFVSIDPTTVTVSAPTAPESIIEPWWIELPVDQAFWRVWRMNSLHAAGRLQGLQDQRPMASVSGEAAEMA